uniref:Uncharacterized protein n=1 Tax=Anguilla anguilla TaxID=7936 RepID=A0A0E9U3K4_ANGAN
MLCCRDLGFLETNIKGYLVNAIR